MVVWDTGSGTLLLESSECSSCKGDVLEIDDSSTFAYVSPAAYDGVTYLDGTELSGQLATDTACPTTTSTSCATGFQFVAITTNDGLGVEEDGILGMWSGSWSLYDTTEMFMYAMDATSDITENTFSYYLTGTDEQSYLDFGAPNTAAY